MADDGVWDRARFARRFPVSRETLERLEIHHALLQRWQPVKNLVAPQTLADAWRRHFADSAQLAPFVAGARTIVDIGSGAGFPGLVLAILLGDDSLSRVHLVESNARKCAFLRDVARQTGVQVDVHDTRIEVAAKDPTSVFGAEVDVVTARAVAPLDALLALSQPLVGSRGRSVLLKGATLDAEVDVARRRWSFAMGRAASVTDPGGRIVTIEDLHPLKGEPQ
ncbi:MAG: 16S rRNA (guanine(527)-N(7))-methyltransferase RsmG [Rhizobiales bacterium]|nr:16S rRNA (guanine(527)-N(7))-methyltransferase RsmG [Hyphomicrobiales bacterium]